MHAFRMTHDEHFRSSTSHGEPVRCSFCGALLATKDDTGLRIQRGQMEAVIDGTFRALVVCYAPKCRRLNAFSIDRKN